MDLPILNKGSYLYTAKLNVTFEELEKLMRVPWYKLKGEPFNYRRGPLFKIIASWRNSDEILYHDERLIPVYKYGKCVAFAEIETMYYDELSKFKWKIHEGYAMFFNDIMKMSIYMHRYIKNFPEDMVVDHVRWNRLDNRECMLRICTFSENNNNMSYRRKLVKK
jgi:hypothetical protein